MKSEHEVYHASLCDICFLAVVSQQEAVVAVGLRQIEAYPLWFIDISASANIPMQWQHRFVRETRGTASTRPHFTVCFTISAGLLYLDAVVQFSFWRFRYYSRSRLTENSHILIV